MALEPKFTEATMWVKKGQSVLRLNEAEARKLIKKERYKEFNPNQEPEPPPEEDEAGAAEGTAGIESKEKADEAKKTESAVDAEPKEKADKAKK
jgi:hypothetical protein